MSRRRSRSRRNKGRWRLFSLHLHGGLDGESRKCVQAFFGGNE
jgi:hypothetical protein